MPDSAVPASQRKVAVFVTRGAGEATELVLTWHTGGGYQLPAGTVEPGESFPAAALREVSEEAGLDDVDLVRDLGTTTITMPEDRALLLGSVPLRFRPDGPPTRWRLTHVAVDVLDHRDDWTLISFGERDLEDPDSVEIARLTGWVRSEQLARVQQRCFFHAVSRDARTVPWQLEGEPGMDFQVAWHPLDRLPPLIPSHAAWLARHPDTLRRPAGS